MHAANRMAGMATLTIRNVEPRLRDQLRLRAARHGQSMEAELRDILRVTLAMDQGTEINLAEAIRHRFAPFGGVDLADFVDSPAPEPPSFDG